MIIAAVIIGLAAAFIGIRALLTLLHGEPPRRERPTLRCVSDRQWRERE